MNELKPCPFCGGEAIIKYGKQAGDGNPGYFPTCDNCGVAPAFAFFIKGDAINWWNTRFQVGEVAPVWQKRRVENG